MYTHDCTCVCILVTNIGADIVYMYYLLLLYMYMYNALFQLILDGCTNLTQKTIANIITAMPSIKRVSMCGTNVTRRPTYEGVELDLSGCPILYPIGTLENVPPCKYTVTEMGPRCCLDTDVMCDFDMT